MGSVIRQNLDSVHHELENPHIQLRRGIPVETCKTKNSWKVRLGLLMWDNDEIILIEPRG